MRILKLVQNGHPDQQLKRLKEQRKQNEKKGFGQRSFVGGVEIYSPGPHKKLVRSTVTSDGKMPLC